MTKPKVYSHTVTFSGSGVLAGKSFQMPPKKVFPFDDDRYNIVVMPSALRCVACTCLVLQAFEDDGEITADKECFECRGRGTAPIPLAELGL